MEVAVKIIRGLALFWHTGVCQSYYHHRCRYHHFTILEICYLFRQTRWVNNIVTIIIIITINIIIMDNRALFRHTGVSTPYSKCVGTIKQWPGKAKLPQSEFFIFSLKCHIQLGVGNTASFKKNIFVGPLSRVRPRNGILALVVLVVLGLVPLRSEIICEL